MSDESETLDPAAQLRADIESAIEEQEPFGKSSGPAEREPAPDGPGPEPRPFDKSGGRDEKGRFAPKAGGPSTEPLESAKEPREGALAPDAAKIPVRPPPGFSVASKEAWDGLPPSIRDDIAKREQEVDNGFKRYGGLGKFAEEAERNGTTLQNAVTDYVAVESTLRQDFIGGIEHICQRLGVDPRALAQAMAFRYGVAASHGAPSQTEGAAGGQAIPGGGYAIDPMAIASHVADVLREETEQRELNSKIASFAVDPKNRFFANLRQDMAQIVQAGKAETLEQAYEAACWLNPEIRAILINEANSGKDKEAAAAVSRSRNAAKAVGGSPAPGINPDAPAKRQNLSLEDEIRANVDAQIGAA